MDKLNHDSQLKCAGMLLRDEARSGSAKQCAHVVGLAFDIISNARKNPNITHAARSVLGYAHMHVHHARKVLSGKGGAS